MFKDKYILISQLLFLLFFIAVFSYLFKNYNEQQAKFRIEYAMKQNEAITNYSRMQKKTIEKLKKEGILEKDFFDANLMSSSRMTAWINKEYKRLLDIQYHIGTDYITIKSVSNNPLNMHNSANDFEKSLMKQMQDDEKTEMYAKTVIANDTYTVYAKLERNSALCLRCHGDPSIAPKQLIEAYGIESGFNEHKGDVRALTVVYTPLYVEDKNQDYLFYALVATLTILLLSVFIVMRMHRKELNAKNKLIAEQTRLALGEHFAISYARKWQREADSLIHLKGDALQHGIVSHQKSLENFNTIFNQEQEKELTTVSDVLDSAIASIQGENKFKEIAFNKHYLSNSVVNTKSKILYVSVLELLHALYTLSTSHENVLTQINVIEEQKQNEVKITFTASCSMLLIVDDELKEEHQNALEVGKILIENELEAQLDIRTKEKMVVISIIYDIMS